MAHLTREEVIKSGEVSPIYQKAFEARPPDTAGTPGDFNSYRVARAAHLEKLRHLYPIPGPIPEHVIETMHDVPARDGYNIRVRVYQPVAGPPEGGSPMIVMYHEGGWAMGDLTDEDLNCRMFARDLGAVCVNVEYRLAPEHQFPIGVNDCWDALKWAITHSSDFNATPSRGLIVGGASAGGNIAAVLALLSRDENLSPPVTGQFLCCAVVLPETDIPSHLSHLWQSRTEMSKDPVLKDLPAGLIDQIYAPERLSPLWDPYNNPNGHKGAPRAFFQVGGIDPLRDEAVMYDVKLREAGVLTRFELYEGFGHMFWTNYPEMEESTNFVKDTLQGMKWLLEK